MSSEYGSGSAKDTEAKEKTSSESEYGSGQSAKAPKLDSTQQQYYHYDENNVLVYTEPATKKVRDSLSGSAMMA